MPALYTPPGSRAGLFGHGRGQPPGSLHQGVELLDQFTGVGNPRDLADPSTEVGSLFGTPDFLWVAGDGNNPTIGPAMVATGAPTAATAPYRVDGQDMASEVYTVAQNRAIAAAYDPAITNDVVVHVLMRVSCELANSRLFGTRGAGAGFEFYTTVFAGTTFLVWLVSDGGATQNGTVLSLCSWVHGVFIIDRTNNLLQTVANGTLGDSDAIVGLGDIASGAGFQIGARPLVTGQGEIAFLAMEYGDGAAARWVAGGHALAQTAYQVFTGIAPAQGAEGVFARANPASWQDRNGIWRIAPLRLPRAGDDDGLRLAPTRVNQGYLNINPQAGDAAANLTITGGVATEQNDAAALAAADASSWGPNVYQFANATGVTQYVRMSQQTGDVNPRSLQCLVRRTAGAGAVNLGLYNEVGGAFVAGSAINDGYGTRTLVHGQVPAAATCTLCLEVADATTVRFVAHDMSTGPRCTTPVPNWGAAAPVTRNADVFTTSDTPDDLTGGFGLDVTPLGWSAAETGGASLLGRAGGGNAMLYTTAAGVWELDLDGTTLITSTVGPADGVSQRIDVRWASGGLMTLTIDGAVWSAAYDGTVQNAGAWEFEVDGGEMAVRNFYTVRNGSG
jgi:hypothetical protein